MYITETKWAQCRWQKSQFLLPKISLSLSPSLPRLSSSLPLPQIGACVHNIVCLVAKKSRKKSIMSTHLPVHVHQHVRSASLQHLPVWLGSKHTPLLDISNTAWNTTVWVGHHGHTEWNVTVRVECHRVEHHSHTQWNITVTHNEISQSGWKATVRVEHHRHSGTSQSERSIRHIIMSQWEWNIMVRVK